VNDVSGTLWSVAAECGTGWVAMHRKGGASDMQENPSYDDVVREVHEHLVGAFDRARRDGVGEIWLDPGIGFGKTVAHNLALLAHVGELVSIAQDLGARVLVGTSHKWFLGMIGSGGSDPLPPDERAEGSLASMTWAMAQGAHMVRVHDVAASVRAALLVGSTTQHRSELEGASV
jgi:dihydropteroate synthase